MHDDVTPEQLVQSLPENVRCVVRSAQDKKAFDVVVLFFDNAQGVTDYFVLCSARTTRQVRAVADEVKRQLRLAQDAPSHIEGYDHGEWVLMDYFDFVVHVFTPDTRRFYDLERLWGSATRIPVPEEL